LRENSSGGRQRSAALHGVRNGSTTKSEEKCSRSTYVSINKIGVMQYHRFVKMEQKVAPSPACFASACHFFNNRNMFANNINLQNNAFEPMIPVYLDLVFCLKNSNSAPEFVLSTPPQKNRNYLSHRCFVHSAQQ
jgi:hypothetical protein